MPANLDPQSFARETDPPIRGFLHMPSASNGNGMILAHGAGSSAQAPLLVALSQTFSDAGFTVLRIDLPYRQTRSFGPPSPATASRDRAGLKNSVLEMQKIVSGKVFLGGHSYGGRQSSMLCVKNRISSRAFSCSRIRCIPRASRNNNELSICPTFVQRLYSSAARAIHSAQSLRLRKRSR